MANQGKGISLTDDDARSLAATATSTTLENGDGGNDMTYFKVLTHDRRPPIKGGSPLWAGRLPATLPDAYVDTSNVECGSGWNCVTDLAAGFRIAGMWRSGRPTTVVVVEPSGTVVTRGDKTRSSLMKIVRRATAAEIREGVETLSVPFGAHAPQMVRSQIAWRNALARPLQDESKVEAGLVLALEARGLAGWKLRQFPSARDVLDAQDAWDEWAVRAVRAARDAWDARAARDEWAARDAWVAWDVRDALTVEYAAQRGWTDHRPDLLTAGIRSAYRQGLGVAVPVDGDTLGWAMDDLETTT